MDGYSTERVNKLREIEFDYTYLTNERWKEIIAVYLRGAKNFEIHCWDEETEIRKPLLHGCVCFHVAAVLCWWYLVGSVA